MNGRRRFICTKCDHLFRRISESFGNLWENFLEFVKLCDHTWWEFFFVVEFHLFLLQSQTFQKIQENSKNFRAIRKFPVTATTLFHWAPFTRKLCPTLTQRHHPLKHSCVGIFAYLFHYCCPASKLFGSRAREALISVLLISCCSSLRLKQRLTGRDGLWQLREASQHLPWSKMSQKLSFEATLSALCCHLLWAPCGSPSWWPPWAPRVGRADWTRADCREGICDWAHTERDTWCIHSASKEERVEINWVNYRSS